MGCAKKYPLKPVPITKARMNHIVSFPESKQCCMEGITSSRSVESNPLECLLSCAIKVVPFNE